MKTLLSGMYFHLGRCGMHGESAVSIAEESVAWLWSAADWICGVSRRGQQALSSHLPLRGPCAG